MVEADDEKLAGVGDEIERAVYFCKQKTAYEVLRSLVGSEMCIRDRGMESQPVPFGDGVTLRNVDPKQAQTVPPPPLPDAVSYTHLTLPTIYSV